MKKANANIVLSIGAHPDDIEIGAAGALLKLKDQGYRLVHLVVTNGDAGSLEIPKAELAAIRKAEAQAASVSLGAEQTIFLDAPDGLLSYTHEMKIAVVKVIRQLKPAVIFTHAAQDHFKDHQVVHQLTMTAVVAAQGPWYQDAGGEPYTVPEIYGYEVWNPLNVFQTAVDISEYFERKILALSKHSSQMSGVNYIGAVSGLAQYRGAMAMRGRYAEVFEVIRTSGVL